MNPGQLIKDFRRPPSVEEIEAARQQFEAKMKQLSPNDREEINKYRRYLSRTPKKS